MSKNIGNAGDSNRQKKIVIISTSARGGMKAVTDAYNSSDFYSPDHTVFIPAHREGGVFIRSWIALRALIQLIWMLSLNRVELAHMHMATKGSFWRKGIFVLICKLYNIPTVIHLHGGRFAVFYNGSAKWVRNLIRHVFDQASSIIVLSQYWYNFVTPLTNTPVSVINNFVHDNLDDDIIKTKRRPRNILFLGQFGANKGIYDLLSVFSDIAPKYPDTKLICCGNGEIDKVRSIVNELDVSDFIDVPGWISGVDKIEIMHSCSVFVLPSYNEGLPMSIIEAMSFSMAVISTRVGGIPELIDETNGFLIDPGSHEELRDKLIEVFEMDSQSIETMGEASRGKYLRSFTPESCLSEMRSLYLSLGVAP
ncbi:MAG: glycosyltransferase family 4 protein [Candidatus Thiodiazotropha taylori]|nr:glycosyltransferase family 4 protein [Candidatus Thiodiazotropha taylori]